MTLTPDDIERIARKLYDDPHYRGRPAWQVRLAEGLAVAPRTVRGWVAPPGTPTHRSVPPTIADLLVEAERVAVQLRMWEHDTTIARRLADIAEQAE